MAVGAGETGDPALLLERGCALFDRSERGKLALSGPESIEFLNGQVTNELAGLEVGEGRFAAFLNHKGGMLGDLRILHAVDPAEGERGPMLLLDTERIALQPLFDVLRTHVVGFDTELHKRTLQRGLISLIGPDSAQLAGAADLGDREHDSTGAVVAGMPVLAVRTDIGIDLICDSEHSSGLVRELRAAGATNAEEEALTTLRIEHGRPVFGIDIGPGTIPQEAGLNERAVSFTKGCYVGQETVARLYYKGRPNRHLRGVAAQTPLQNGEELTLDGRTVGAVTSTAVSPRFGPIALAMLRREAEPGVQLERGDGSPATVVELPFAAVAAVEHR